MEKYIPIREYRKIRPKRQEVFGPLYKVLNKITRDWVFSSWLRYKLWKFMGVILPDNCSVFVARETWIDDNFPELVRVDDGVVMGWRCTIMAHNTMMMPPSVAPVHIKRKAFLGQGVTVLPGVTIGEYAQIGAGAVVTRDIEPYTVAVGIPAKPVRKLTQEEIDLRNSPVYLG